MTTSVLSLPIDIPWKRICASADMIDREICDRRYPYRWRSSLAVFSYEPPEEDQEYPDETISYLKIASTITGFQPDPDEVGLSDRRVDSYWNDPAVIDNYKDVASKYYGCYGAIIEVAIGPQAGTPAAAGLTAMQYPYFADFEPKKRELYEQVSETGETMSRSLDSLNVRKGLTTTESHEVLDIFSGAQAQASYAGTGGGFGFSGQWGTKDISQQEYSNVRTAEQARELRETFSHTTQLTQMYHQLASYHIGTNRAVFFLLPRPHIVQAPLTFVNGPRLLEGVQELFLVVVRPKTMEDFCVDAYLETGHIVSEPQYTYETSTGTVTLHVAKSAEDTSGSFGDDSNTTYAEGSETYNPPSGWEVDLSNSGGYRIESASGTRIEDYGVTEADTDHVTIWGKVSAYFEDRTWPQDNVSFNGVLDLTVTVYIRKVKPNITGYDQNLWITGRGVCCCDDGMPISLIESVNWEGALGMKVAAKIGAQDAMTVVESNAIRHEVGRRLIESVNHPDRSPRGELKFADTQFMGRIVATLVRKEGHPDNVSIGHIRGVERAVAEKVTKTAPLVSRGKLLQMPLQEMVDRFGITEEQAVHLRRAALGLTTEAPKGERRWEPPAGRRRPAPKRKGPEDSSGRRRGGPAAS